MRQARGGLSAAAVATLGSRRLRDQGENSPILAVRAWMRRKKGSREALAIEACVLQGRLASAPRVASVAPIARRSGSGARSHTATRRGSDGAPSRGSADAACEEWVGLPPVRLRAPRAVDYQARQSVNGIMRSTSPPSTMVARGEEQVIGRGSPYRASAHAAWPRRYSGGASSAAAGAA